MSKPDFCLCENNGADHLHSNCKADQHLCFCYTDSTIPLLPKFQASSQLLAHLLLTSVEPFAVEAACVIISQIVLLQSGNAVILFSKLFRFCSTAV